MSAEGFQRVLATTKELAEWRAHTGRPNPSVHRVECTACHRRIWGSGLGIGAHRRACPSHLFAGERRTDPCATCTRPWSTHQPATVIDRARASGQSFR